jgi:hypothetical protein
MKTTEMNVRNADRLGCCLAIATIVLMNPFSNAVAQSADAERFSFSLGVFITDRDSKTRLDAQVGGMTGTEVDVEGDLGVDNSDTVFRLDGYYRFNEKHRVDFSWFDLSRTGTKQIQRDIDWNDSSFPLDTVINSEFDLAIYKAAYTWSFLRRDTGYIGLTAGLYVADIKTALSAPAIMTQEVGDITAPLPVFGLRGEYNFSEKWSFRASGEFFVFEYEDFDGSLYDLYVGLDYQLFDRMAVGVGINSVKMDIGVVKENVTGNLDWQYDGGLIFLKFDF